MQNAVNILPRPQKSIKFEFCMTILEEKNNIKSCPHYKMLLKRNLLETVTILSCSGSILGILLNCFTNVSPITGFWFLSYIFILLILSIFLSFNCIQWLLQLNKPVKYDVEGVFAKYPYLSFIRNLLPQIPKVSDTVEHKEYDTNELSIISTVLERKLVSSWYVPYISQEIGFPFACKQLLDQMISKTFKICDKIDIQEVYVDICAILVNHLKEYKKALKRHENFPNNTIDTLYKKSHPVSDINKKHASADHCTNILRIVMKELVPWELWDTPHSELLVRILSKKLDNFIETTISDPVWLNDKLHTLLNETSQNNVTIDETNIDQKVTPEVQKTEVKPPVTDNKPSSTPKEPAEEIKEEKVEKENSQAQVEDFKPTAVLRQRRGRQGRNEVKIYDRIIEGSVKTWDTDMDLQCISVGQDLLAGLDEIPLSRLWGHEDTEHSPNNRNASPQPLWFGEEDAIELDLEPQKEVKKETSPKPTDVLLKDLQTTVHQAKTKIGDLQVPKNVDVPRKHSGDEAAGMMEGLLDKGIAGLKKGLRFTGLSDEPQEKSPSHQRDKVQEKVSPELPRAKGKTELAAEGREINIPQGNREENGSALHLLVKQHRVTSQDSVPLGRRVDSPPLPDSPEPEYEEAADLSSSIAKLRSLLQEAAPREEVWWESAEETRGRTQNHASSRPVDTATLADEYDMNLERGTSPGQSTNNMQRLDKLFQRTVTGVFNSIKTAVGGEETGEEAGGVVGGARRAPAPWTYVCSAAELSVGGAVARLVGSRKAMAHVDAALDSLQQLPPSAQPPLQPEDLEEWCMGEGARWSGTCELLGVVGLLRSHLAHRAATLLCADVVEGVIRVWLAELGVWLRRQVFLYFQQLSAAPAPPAVPLRPLDLDETCRLLREKIPETYLFSEESLSEAIRLAVDSLSHRDVVRDVVFRALDSLVLHFQRSGGLRQQSFDNN